MENIVVSVCIATCNQERYLDECLESVIGQIDGLACEILIGDDMSEDATPEIVARWAALHPGVIKHFRHAPRLGPAANYQFIVTRARGEFIAHLDGDDMWLPGKIAGQLAFMNAHTDCPAVYTNAIVIDDKGALRGLFNNQQPDRFDLAGMLKYGNFLNHSSLLYRQKYASAIIAISPPFVDYLMHLRLVEFGALGYINRPGVLYRINSSTSMIVNANEHTRELYWQALTSASGKGPVAKELAAGKGDFLRRTFFRATRMRSPKMFIKWWRRVLADHTPHRSIIFFSALVGIIKTTCAIAREGVGIAVGRGVSRVFYRR
ncbi:glycosyltransferase [Metallibacterium sp.]|uniref:glycosyltransferase n=1 Tax=Metallibacterium sp. TaxID=2940281 RepID=UPI0026128DA8|nr:glycosyltransferase [Metallibacterium sp.]